MRITESDSSRCTELIAKHDAFFFIEYPMRMAMLYAEIAIAKSGIEISAAKHRAKSAKDDSEFYRKLYNL